LSPVFIARKVGVNRKRAALEACPMSYFPIFVEMKKRRCLVIGGGVVAERKIAGLLEVGAAVTVISPDVTEKIARWSREKLIQFLARRYQAGDLPGYELAFVATSDCEVNAAAFEEGRECGVWVNSADDPAHCDFILPSVLRRGDLTVAVSSGGGSPALARTIREELEMYLSQEYEQLARLAAEARAEVHKRALDVPFETWRRALSGDVRQFLMRGEVARAKSHLLKELGVAL
jgi:precorrin-2 dehydrogenase / sirohydrochlorin ferrochelatase